VAGKFLAAISPWPAAMLITIPYLRVLSQGDEVFVQSLYWGFLFGSLLSLGYTGLGMLTSIWSNSNRTSFGVSLVIYLICALPVQFPGNAQTGTMGRVLKAVNPMAATDHYLEKVLVNNRTNEELISFIISPIAFPIIVLALLFVVAAPRLRLEGGAPFTFRPKWGRVAGLLLVAFLFCAMNVYPAIAAPADAPRPEGARQDAATVTQLPLEITIDTTAKVVKNGDPIFFNTKVTNNDTQNSPSLIVAMNIINLNGDGDPVDPEDWSPERTQYLDRLAPGQSAEHAWRLNTILEGDYMLYMVLVPTPGGPEETTWPHTSAGMHVTVERYVRTNPGGVLPYAVGGPVVLLTSILLIYRYRRRGVDMGDAS
jgi:hypothetical protein